MSLSELSWHRVLRGAAGLSCWSWHRFKKCSPANQKLKAVFREQFYWVMICGSCLWGVVGEQGTQGNSTIIHWALSGTAQPAGKTRPSRTQTTRNAAAFIHSLSFKAILASLCVTGRERFPMLLPFLWISLCWWDFSEAGLWTQLPN